MRSSCRDTKNRKLYGVIVLLLTICVFLCGCTQAERQNKVRVSIVDSVLFKAENTAAEIERGRDFKTVLSLRAGYEFVSCDYSDYTATEKGGKTELTLKNIERPSRVTVTCRKKEFQNVVDIDLKCTVNYSLTEHHRPNTIAGAAVKRRGHVLTGWNTRPDGNGEHIGLGSRVTVRDGKEITLYAEWKKSIDGGQFLYRQAADGTLALTGYRGRGDLEPFVIPSEIHGKAVSEISSSFTTNMPCGELTSQTLVLPDSIRFVKSNSFLRSSFSELYFSDNIEDIDEKAFPCNIKTFHINAFRKPCFQAVNNSIIFSDNIDRLILNADRRKLIFFSGCSFAYGLNSGIIDEAYGGEYAVFNMGVNGDINAAFQMEILLAYMGEGDVFIHAPEEMSASQLMFDYFVNDSMFIMTEGNYDLLALVDFSDNGGVIRAFFDYI